ncbi:hypothetical protein A9CBEGH2_08180 [Amedibacterium intestinale]|uniref:hypothetical protein n=1 Tax=Amedibacterium intestinale TaxID=2583452 RepID=UPI001373E0AB|nr:hypothetical protein [Amedibacterium intestinale]BBK61878.1 hypothetical protein A9CBEGH2_08180 [Amedibacterium intestinale]
MKIVKWSTILLLLATPLFIVWANQYRESFGFGGETLVSLFPMLIYLSYHSTKDLVKTIKEECF